MFLLTCVWKIRPVLYLMYLVWSVEVASKLWSLAVRWESLNIDNTWPTSLEIRPDQSLWSSYFCGRNTTKSCSCVHVVLFFKKVPTLGFMIHVIMAGNKFGTDFQCGNCMHLYRWKIQSTWFCICWVWALSIFMTVDFCFLKFGAGIISLC